MMNMKYDEEIREVEARLMYEREALVHGAEDFTHAAKCMAASPKGLALAAVVGFLIGEVTRSKRRPERQPEPATSKIGLGSILGGLSLAVIKAQFGSPLGLGKAALEYAAARRRSKSEAALMTTASSVAGSEAGWGPRPPPSSVAPSYGRTQELPPS